MNINLSDVGSITLFNAGLTFLPSLVYGFKAPPRLEEAYKELHILLEKALDKTTRLPQPENMPRKEYLQMIINGGDGSLKKALERFQKESDTPKSYSEYALAFSIAGRMAAYSAVANVSGCMAMYSVRKIADCFFNPKQSRQISIVAGTIFTGFATYQLTKSHPLTHVVYFINGMWFLLLSNDLK